MRLEDMDFKKTYGDVPASFQHRVQYALRQTEEAKPVKRLTRLTVVLVVVLVALATTAVAATISKTIEFFSKDYNGLINYGTVLSGSHSIQLGDVVFTLGDVVYTHINTDYVGYDWDEDSSFFFATGTIAPAEGANVILMTEDYGVEDPCPTVIEGISDGTLSYGQLAEITGADVIWVHALCDGVLDENGELVQTSVGYDLIPQEDGTVFMAFQIPYGADSGVSEAESYTLSIYIAAQGMTPDGETVDALISDNWNVEVKAPAGASMRPSVPEKTQAPADSTIPPADESALEVRQAADVLYANWYETVEKLCMEETVVTVTDPSSGISWQASVISNGHHADGAPLTDADAEAMVRAVDSTWEPRVVWVTFPNGETYLASQGSIGYGEIVAYEDEEETIPARRMCIHFPRTQEQAAAIGVYALSQQEAISAAWQALQGQE